HRGRDAKADRVDQRIELLAEPAARLRGPGDAAVQGIEEAGKDDQPAGSQEVPRGRGHDRPHTEEEVPQCEGARDDDDALLQPRPAHGYSGSGSAPGSCMGNSSSVKPVSRRNSARYRSDVASITWDGRGGGGAFLSHLPSSTSSSR